MEKALQIINQMQEERVFEKYAIGGGIAAIFYIEPFATFDLDVFIILQQESNLISLASIYTWLEKKGYLPEKEQIIIEGIPVQFIPAYNDLVEEAIINAESKKYGKTNTLIVSKEYLVAIMLQTNRQKDRERIQKFIDQSDFSIDHLMKILKKYNLTQLFNNIRKN